MPEVLTKELLDDALHGLQDWSTDGSQITRDVELDDSQHEQVAREVDEVQTAMDHHADITREGGTTHFVLSTHSEGGVTSRDIMLASEINSAVRNATGETAPRPPDDVVGTHATPDTRDDDPRTSDVPAEDAQSSGERTAALVAEVQGTQGQTGEYDEQADVGGAHRAATEPDTEQRGAGHESAHREVWPERGEEVTTSAEEATDEESGRHRQTDNEREHVRDWEYEQRGGAQGVVSTDEPDRGGRDEL